MNEFKILPDDPRLTAYALGELEGDERAAVEVWLQAHPEAGAVVDDIRAAAAQLENALSAEATGATDSPASVGREKTPVPDPYAPPARGKLLRFPQIYYIVGGLAAACFAVVLALHEQPVSHPVTRRFEMSLQTPASQTTATSSVPVALPVAAVPAETAVAEMPAVIPVAPETVQSNAKGFGGDAQVSLPSAMTFDGKIGLPPPIGHASPAQVVAGNLARAHRSVDVPLAKALTGIEGGAASGSRAQFAAVKPPASMGAASNQAQPFGAPSGHVATDEVVKLSPFEVKADANLAFVARLSAAGERLKQPASSWASVSTGRTATFSGESYEYRRESDFLAAAENPLSTFSIDVDTASYANLRRMIESGNRPPIDSVRIEEMLNYFPYSYASTTVDENTAKNATESSAAPFSASMEVAEAPWAPDHRLVRIGLKGREVNASQRGAANLVFLLDVSGSMSTTNKLPLVKESMRLLVGRLRLDDRVAIVTYAGTTGLALPSTPVAKAREIIEAIDDLGAHGSTNGGMGIQLAYDVAKANFVRDGINRVILCTDGDFNVGVTSPGDLVRLITEKAKSGVFLTALGFGMGNYKDATLQRLADAGNGNYGYIDRRREAEKLLVEQVSGTLVTIAKDVKIQVEFNPEKVASYRLIGYEKRLLAKEDFNNDAVDAGEIGAGHTVTALYEIVPVGTADEDRMTADGIAAVDELRYQKKGTANTERRTQSAESGSLKRDQGSNELLTLKVRYKEPDGNVSQKLEFPLVDAGRGFEQASSDFKFASAVAAFWMILRDSTHKGAATLDDVVRWAEAGESPDPGGYRAEFLSLVRQAKTIL